MVDAIVSYAVERLGDYLTQEAVVLQGIEGEVKLLQRELRFMRSFLKDADKKQGSNESIRTWISEIQDIAYDTEDIIDAFIFNVNNPNESIHSSTWFRSYLGNPTCKKAKLYDIGKDIEDLKKRVVDINRQRETYGINNLGITQNNVTSGGGGGLRITTPYGDEDLDVVGFEDDFQQLQEKLFDGTQSRSVISILGMGGLGKTTLARKLYNNNKTEFTKHAWICVSQEWNTGDLLRKLIKSFLDLTNEEREKVDKMEFFELVRYLRDRLENRRYLVVIDDLWHGEAWECIKKAFPENKNGSRIIVTTRKEDVAELQYHSTLVHKLRFLRDEESWSLFCKNAFPDKNGVCPDDLEKLGKELTAKCGGLPLAIIVLGGLLSRKQFHEWLEVKEHIWREVEEKAINDISSLLDLSYDDLPINVKSCFLYLGIFQEDALIEVKDLVDLWVAEGFIPIDEEGRTPEEVSECYFKELLGRNLVQTAEWNWRMTSSCRIHDLLRDLALKKARETNFFRVYHQIGSSFSLPTTSCRRVAIHSVFTREELPNQQKVRTLYLLNASIVWSFKLLRVLKIQGVDLRESRYLEGVGEMIHLRFLGLTDTHVRELPNTIGNLKVLQTLHVNEVDNSFSLPKDIGKLKELRHLTGRFLIEDFPNLAGLGNLQTFKLFLTRLNMEAHDEGLDFLGTLTNLRTLKVIISRCFPPVTDPLLLESLLNCKELIELSITRFAKIRQVPKDIHKYLWKLKFLQLNLSHDEEDPIPKLELLPNLVALRLSYVIFTKTISWTFTAKGFPQLEFLKLEYVSIMELRVEEGAMPRLRFLCLDDAKLKQIHFHRERFSSLPRPRFLCLDAKLKQTHFPERFWSLPGEEAMNWKFDT